MLQQALASGHYAWAAAALAVSVLTLYSMMKIWLEAFWKPHPDPAWRPRTARLGPAWVATGALACVTLAIGLDPQVLMAYASDAAAQLGLR